MDNLYWLSEGQCHVFDPFAPKAVRILSTRGRSISLVANDLGIGKSTLDRWRRIFAEKDLLSGPHEDMRQELSRRRKENELLRRNVVS